MSFYQQCLGDELTLTKLGVLPMKDQFPRKTQSHDEWAAKKRCHQYFGCRLDGSSCAGFSTGNTVSS
ncbi:hypothetical protein [Spirosoma flavus]